MEGEILHLPPGGCKAIGRRAGQLRVAASLHGETRCGGADSCGRLEETGGSFSWFHCGFYTSVGVQVERNGWTAA